MREHLTYEAFLDFYRTKGRLMTTVEASDHIAKEARYRVKEVKVGTGEKQTSVFYLHEGDDPKGEYFQVTATSLDAIEWSRLKIVRSCAENRLFFLRQRMYDEEKITWFGACYDYPRARDLTRRDQPERTNLDAARVSSNPRVKLSGAVCERIGQNFQWIADMVFDALSPAEFEVLEEADRDLPALVAGMSDRIGDKGDFPVRVLEALTAEERAILKATQPPPKTKKAKNVQSEPS